MGSTLPRARAEEAVEVGGQRYQVTQGMVRGSVWPAPLGVAGLVLTSVLLAPVLVPAVLLMALLPADRRKRIVAAILTQSMGVADGAMRGIREEVIRVEGCRVLDVGCGPALYLPYYKRAKAASVTLLEPNPHFRPVIEAAVEREGMGGKAAVFTGFVRDLKPAELFDVVLLGNVCCEIPDVPATLREIDAVLKPGGRVIFFEHVRREGSPVVCALQDAVNPAWRTLLDGCNVNRDTLSWIKAVPGWSVTSWALDVPAPVFLSRTVVGIAVKAAAAGA